MPETQSHKTYIALLRGINVGGHHKVPMAKLRDEMKGLGFRNVSTLLNSGNAIFDADVSDLEKTEQIISGRLEEVFGFPVPVLIRDADDIHNLIKRNPFSGVELGGDIRLYTTFLKNTPRDLPDLPLVSDDKSYQILEIRNGIVCIVLDLGITKTPKVMDNLEKMFGKDITTRNWNTIIRIGKRLKAG